MLSAGNRGEQARPLARERSHALDRTHLAWVRAASLADARAGDDRPRRRDGKILPIVEGVVLVAALVAPLVLQDYLTVFATRVIILALFALSFDLVWGYAGIMSFGQALFFGSAGYGVALLARDLDITNIFLVLPAGIADRPRLRAAARRLPAARAGIPSSVIFVSLGTLTGSYAADRLARGWYYLGGQNGIPSIPPMTLGGYEFSEGPAFYYLVLGILVVVYLLCRFLVRSQFGLALAGLRENEQRIAFFGYKAQHLKAIIFAIGGAVAGLAGSLYAFHEGFVWPNMVGVVVSTQVVLYVLFGGSGTLIGAVIGAVIVEGVSFWLSDNYRDIWPIILGVLLLLVILFRPLGLISFVLGERERVGSFGAGTARRSAMPLLEAAGIDKIFGKLTALDGAALTVGENEFHGLIGPNGSGKSTLMKCIAGAEVPTQGKVCFVNTDITAFIADRACAGRHEPEIPDHQRAAVADAVRQHPARAPGAVLAARPGVLAHARRAARSGHDHADAVPSRRPRRSTRRLRCRTASSNGWRSRWRSPASRNCCCSTSRPAA